MDMPNSRGDVNSKSTSSPQYSAPHNIEAEQALLGSLLLSNSVMERLPDIDGAHFFDPLHQEIFTAISTRIAAGQVADPVTLRPQFERHPMIDEIMTVPKYLGTLAINGTTAINAPDYARTIIDFAARRRLVEAGLAMVDYACNSEAGTELIVAEAERTLLDVSEARGTNSLSTFREAVGRVMEAANDAYISGGRPIGLPTGLIDIDKDIGGLAPGKLIIIAGRPAMGKSALAINIAWNLAKLHATSGGKEGCPVQAYSMEMQADELAARVLATESEVPANRILSGEMDEAEASRVFRVGLEIQDTPLTIDDAGGLTLARLSARARRQKRKTDFGLLVIDYLQLIAGTSGAANRVQDVTEITTGLKALAKDLGVPIIALSQLSRKVEERADKRPQLADLRESGSIEQDADIVMFVFREEYYLEREKPGEDDLQSYGDWQQKMNACAGKGEVIIGKNRAGKSGALIPVAWDARLTRFSNLAISERAFR